MLLISLISLCFATEYQYWGHWNEPPTVALCDSTNMPWQDVRKAMDYWESRGYEFGDFLFWDKCSNKKIKGVIKITPPGNYIDVTKHYGYTTVRTVGVNDDIITSSIIEMAHDGIDNSEVIIHEMGHALGIKHVSDTSDIMYHKHTHYITDLSVKN
jgi:hypothetical protein